MNYYKNLDIYGAPNLPVDNQSIAEHDMKCVWISITFMGVEQYSKSESLFMETNKTGVT